MEFKNEKDLQIGSVFGNYKIIKKADEGGFAKVYLAENEKTKKQYAIKVLKKFKTPRNGLDPFLKEIEILKILSNSNKSNNYTPHLYDSGKSEYNNEQRYYYIMDYFPKKDLFEYLKKTKNGFKERHAKLIFSKILKGVKSCHDAGICHLDLHLKNIIFDEKYEPKIIDFSFSQELKDADDSGMFHDWKWKKRCPEFFENHSYNGIKVDIFSLGIMLLNIVTLHFGVETYFEKKIDELPLYSLIKQKNYVQFLKILKSKIPNFSNLSQEFKNLYISMIAYDPNKRPSIEEILKCPWFNEINNLNEEEYQKLEQEVIEEFMKLEEEFKKDNETYTKTSGETRESTSGTIIYTDITDIDEDNEDDDTYKYFDLNLVPKYIEEEGLNAKNYISIKLNLKPARFMNFLLEKISEEFKDNCIIETAKDKIKAKFTFENKYEQEDENNYEVNEEEEDDEECNGFDFSYLGKEPCVICIKVFNYKDIGFEIQFIRKSGDIEDYYEYFNKIKQLISAVMLLY